MADLREFQFDIRSMRFRVTKGAGRGQFISDDVIRKALQDTIANHQKQAWALSQRLINGEINVREWENAIARQLKDATIQMNIFGFGGSEMFGRANRKQQYIAEMESEMRFQLSYLRQFSRQLMDTGMSEARFKQRLNLYFQRTRAQYEQGRANAHVAAGYMWERRFQTKTESCASCILYAARSYQLIGSLPAPTQACECMSNCGCYKKYYKVKPQAETVLQGFGWLNPSTATHPHHS